MNEDDPRLTAATRSIKEANREQRIRMGGMISDEEWEQMCRDIAEHELQLEPQPRVVSIRCRYTDGDAATPNDARHNEESQAADSATAQYQASVADEIEEIQSEKANDERSEDKHSVDTESAPEVPAEFLKLAEDVEDIRRTVDDTYVYVYEMRKEIKELMEMLKKATIFA